MNIPVRIAGLLCLVLWATGAAAADSALFEAVRQDDVARVERLLEEGADVNALDTNGRTPLDLAPSLEMIETLRKAGGVTSKELREGTDPDEEWDMCCLPVGVAKKT